MAKRRKKPGPKPRKFSRGAKRDPQVVMLMEYKITYDPIEEPDQEPLPADVQAKVAELHGLSQTRPRAAIPDLIDLVERHPDVRVFHNFLAVAYSLSGQPEKAEETIRENLRRHPDYLFARLNYAEICLQKGRLDEFAEVLSHKFDLKLLYPDRDTFHISEFVSFSTIVGSYFAALGQTDVAERYYETLKDLEPDHPMTRQLRSRIDRAEDRRKLGEAGHRLRSLFGKRRGWDPGPED
jgi:tetratricopeptide (TPR) repeat protein